MHNFYENGALTRLCLMPNRLLLPNFSLYALKEKQVEKLKNLKHCRFVEDREENLDLAYTTPATSLCLKCIRSISCSSCTSR